MTVENQSGFVASNTTLPNIPEQEIQKKAEYSNFDHYEVATKSTELSECIGRKPVDGCENGYIYLFGCKVDLNQWSDVDARDHATRKYPATDFLPQILQALFQKGPYAHTTDMHPFFHALKEKQDVLD